MNSLSREKSPYLLQHADNPVDWLPWGEAAFARARAENKPIFLSIGYSTCHWCHVMARESFENPETAKLLNAGFIPVKVDREERPDVDRVYMTYVQLATGHGGWPLSAWLTPDLKPFYGGTYYPPADMQGRPGFPSVLRAIARGWESDRDRMVQQAERVVEMLKAHQADASGVGKREMGNGNSGQVTLAEAGGNAFARCFEHFHQTFDSEHGGFGGAPKFPRGATLNFLICAASIRSDRPDMAEAAVQMAAQTLQMMAQGGIHDHVGGGYHRYSVDAEWFVPHFEKMLYDQAQIALNALDVHRATGDERFAWMARDILEYVARDMTSPEGGFYSAEDADSALPGATGHEGHVEGAFYVWTRAEIETATQDAALVAAHFDAVENGNVPAHSDPHGEFTGRNILAQRQSLETTARAFGLTTEAANERLVAALGELRRARERRPRPLRDDKIITAWNGLMISALAAAHAGLGAAGGYLQRAEKACAFIERELYDAGTGVLYRNHRGGRGTSQGFAEDYAFLIQGLLDLHDATFAVRWLEWAVRLQETMDRLLWDAEGGGYFGSAADDASIVVRMKEDYDGAEPAANSVAAMNLLRLGALFDKGSAGMSFRERGIATVEAFRGRWRNDPHALPQMLCCLELILGAPRHVVLVGDFSTADFRALQATLRSGLGPRRALAGIDNDADRAWWAQRAPWMAEMKAIDGKPTAYVCEGYACQAPVNTPEELKRLLG